MTTLSTDDQATYDQATAAYLARELDDDGYAAALEPIAQRLAHMADVIAELVVLVRLMPLPVQTRVVARLVRLATQGVGS